MKIHELKIDAEYSHHIKNGTKTFEIRKNDRDFKIGDILHLRPTVYSGKEMVNGKELIYVINGDMLVKVLFILKGPIFGLEDNWCIMSIKLID